MSPESTAGRAASLGAAFVLVVAMRLMLVVLPFRHVARASAWLAAGRAWLPRQAPVRVAYRIARVARWVPGASCLTQALAATSLLAWHGHASVVRYGVRTTPAGLEAHAWVEHDGVVLVGGPVVDGFVPLEPAQARHVR